MREKLKRPRKRKGLGLLNHSDEAVTMIYAMANSIRRFPKKKLDKC